MDQATLYKQEQNYLDKKNKIILKNLKSTLDLNVDEYFNKLRAYFKDINQILIDSNICSNFSLETIEYVLKKDEDEIKTKIPALLTKYVSYFERVSLLIKNDKRICTTENMIKELMDCDVASKSYLSHLEYVLDGIYEEGSISRKTTKETSNLIKEKIRTMCNLAYDIANLLHPRSVEEHNHYKNKLNSLFNLDYISENDKNLVCTFIKESKRKKSIIMSKDNDIKDLLKILSENRDVVKKKLQIPRIDLFYQILNYPPYTTIGYCSIEYPKQFSRKQ